MYVYCRMRFLPSRSFSSLGVAATLAVGLTVLGVLQYRWTAEASNAEGERLQATMQTAMNQFREDLHRELASVCSAFEIQEAGGIELAAEVYAHRYNQWERSTAHAGLVSDLFLLQAEDERRARLFHLNTSSAQWEAIDCPPRFSSLCTRLSLQPAELVSAQSRRGLPFMWTLEGRVPALIHARFRTSRPRDTAPPSAPRLVGYVVIKLSRSFLEKELLPELAQRYFGGPHGLVYQVAVVSGADPQAALYQSAPVPLKQMLSSPDGVINLFGPRHRHALGVRLVSGARGGDRYGRNGARFRAFRFAPGENLLPLPRGPGFSVIVAGSDRGQWKLAVKRRSGSLGEAVANLRRRNMAVSFGVLLALAVSLAMMVVWTERARKLAKLQLDFVAGVSHEFRTPLAVICSAAENLADGVTVAEQQMKQYGILIREQGRRLSEMVEQILLFARQGKGGRRYEFRPVSINKVIEAALAESAPMIEGAGFTVEKHVEGNLASVVADARALTVCLRNLISNALKYGTASRWLGICAAAAAGGEDSEIRVTVEDRGPGIAADDLRHIFEPFYRGNAAVRGATHGTGLGLSLAKDIAEAMGGRLSVRSSPGQGSSFTLHLPVLRPGEGPSAEVA